MPLTEPVNFKTVLQKGNRIQVPKVVRWRFKLEENQVLKVSVTAEAICGWEDFYAKMDKSGRITIPKLTQKLARHRADKQDLAGVVLEVKLEPA